MNTLSPSGDHKLTGGELYNLYAIIPQSSGDCQIRRDVLPRRRVRLERRRERVCEIVEGMVVGDLGRGARSLFRRRYRRDDIAAQLRWARDMQSLRLVSSLVEGQYEEVRERLPTSQGPTALLHMSDIPVPNNALDGPYIACHLYEVQAELKPGVVQPPPAKSFVAGVYLTDGCPVLRQRLPFFVVAGKAKNNIILPAVFCRFSVLPALCRKRGGGQATVPLPLTSVSLDPSPTVQKLYTRPNDLESSDFGPAWSVSDLIAEYNQTSLRFYQSRFIEAPQRPDMARPNDPVNGEKAGAGTNASEPAPRGKVVADTPAVSFMETLLPVRWVLPLAAVFLLGAQIKIFSALSAFYHSGCRPKSGERTTSGDQSGRNNALVSARHRHRRFRQTMPVSRKCRELYLPV